MCSIKDGLNLIIKKYANAHRLLDEYQRYHPHIVPRQSRKIGAIGEYYSMLLLKDKFPIAQLTFMGHNDPFDIKMIINRKEFKFQVKTTSVFNDNQQLGKINLTNLDYLMVLSLNEELKIDILYVVRKTRLKKFEKNGIIQNLIVTRRGLQKGKRNPLISTLSNYAKAIQR